MEFTNLLNRHDGQVKKTIPPATTFMDPTQVAWVKIILYIAHCAQCYWYQVNKIPFIEYIF